MEVRTSGKVFRLTNQGALPPTASCQVTCTRSRARSGCRLPTEILSIIDLFSPGSWPHSGEPEGLPPLPALPRLTGNLARHNRERHVQSARTAVRAARPPVSRSIVIRRRCGVARLHDTI